MTSDLAAALSALGRPLVVVVTGGRDFHNAGVLGTALGTLHLTYGIRILGAGDARGADAMALAWAHGRVPYAIHFADWNRHGRAAGPIRNGRMLDEANPDLVVAFPGGDGTADCVAQARRRGLRVWEVGA